MGESIPKINEDLLQECKVLPTLQTGTKGEVILLIDNIGTSYNMCKLKHKTLSDAYREIQNATED